MRFKIFGVQFITGKHARECYETSAALGKVREALEGMGSCKSFPDSVVAEAANSQLREHQALGQRVYKFAADIIVDGGEAPKGGVEGVVKQVATELKTLRGWQAMQNQNTAKEVVMLRGKLEKAKADFDGAVEVGLHYENLDKQKSLALRLVLHVLREYLGKPSEVGSVLLEARKAVHGGELLLKHERGHPALLEATQSERDEWFKAFKTGPEVDTDTVTGTRWAHYKHTPPPGGISTAHQAVADMLNSMPLDGSVNRAIASAKGVEIVSIPGATELSADIADGVRKQLGKELMPGGVLHSMRNECR